MSGVVPQVAIHAVHDIADRTVLWAHSPDELRLARPEADAVVSVFGPRRTGSGLGSERGCDEIRVELTDSHDDRARFDLRREQSL